MRPLCGVSHGVNDFARVVGLPVKKIVLTFPFNGKPRGARAVADPHGSAALRLLMRPGIYIPHIRESIIPFYPTVSAVVTVFSTCRQCRAIFSKSGGERKLGPVVGSE